MDGEAYCESRYPPLLPAYGESRKPPPCAYLLPEYRLLRIALRRQERRISRFAVRLAIHAGARGGPQPQEFWAQQQPVIARAAGRAGSAQLPSGARALAPADAQPGAELRKAQIVGGTGHRFLWSVTASLNPGARQTTVGQAIVFCGLSCLAKARCLTDDENRSSVPLDSRSGAALFFGGARGQFVAAVVMGVRGVTLGPDPGRLVAGHLFVQGFPEVLVDHRLFRGGHPALALPAVDPLGDALLHVFGIGHHFDFAIFLQRT